MLDPRLGLLIVRGANVDHVAEGWVAQEGARERPDERHVRLGRDRLSSARRRGAHFANQGEDLVVLDQMVGILDRPLRLVAVVVGDQLEPAAIDPARGVGLPKGREDPLTHAETQGRRGPVESGRLAKHDPVVEHAWLRVRGARQDHARGEPERKCSHFPNERPAAHL